MTHIISNLKNATHAAHSRVELQLDRYLFASDLTPKSYADALTKLYAIHCVFEAQLTRYAASALLMDGRSKLHWLRQDLLALDFAGQWPLSLNQDLVLENDACAMGVMYVVEGSTLGGKVISQRLAQHAWLIPAKHLRFFNSYGARRGKMWRDFCDALENFHQNEVTAGPAIVDGALLAFNYFEQKLLTPATPNAYATRRYQQSHA